MQNQPPYDDGDEQDEEIDPRASLINNSAATREIMMRMLSPQRFPQQQQQPSSLSPMGGNYPRSQRVDDYRLANPGDSSSAGMAAPQGMPMMGGQMGNVSQQAYSGGGGIHAASGPTSGNDEDTLSRMMLLRQQQMATMETNRMLLSMYGRGGEASQDTGSRLSSEEMFRIYSQQQQQGMMPGASMGMAESFSESGTPIQQGRHQRLGGDSGVASRPVESAYTYGFGPDPRSPAQWRNYPPANMMQRPGPGYAPQRLDVPQMPLPDMMWRQTMASATGQKRQYDDPAMAHAAAMAYPGKSEDPPQKKSRASRKKPADMPRRPLSAYNLFFSEERERILAEISGEEGTASTPQDEPEALSEAKQEEGSSESTGQMPAIKALMRPLIPSQKKRRPHRKTHGKISFKELAKMVGQRWKSLPDERRQYYQDLAKEDMKRQKAAMEAYNLKRQKTQEDAVAGVRERESGSEMP